MKTTLMEILGATNRGGMYGLGQQTNQPPPPPAQTCGCHPIFYFGTAVGAIAVIGLFLAAVT